MDHLPLPQGADADQVPYPQISDSTIQYRGPHFGDFPASLGWDRQAMLERGDFTRHVQESFGCSKSRMTLFDLDRTEGMSSQQANCLISFTNGKRV